jgi:hypothetical protein
MAQVDLRYEHAAKKVLVFAISTGFKLPSISFVKDSPLKTRFDHIVFDSVFLNEIGKTSYSISALPESTFTRLASSYDTFFNTYCDMANGGVQQDIDLWLDCVAEELISTLERQRQAIHKTPAALVNKILDRLPAEIWQDPNKKWFDPCCGTGEFVIQIYRRLRKYHSDLHIFENMLYYNDINRTMVDITSFRLDFTNKYKKNSFCYDMLEEVVISSKFKYTKTGKIRTNRRGEPSIEVERCNRFEKEVNMNFDAVVGNPPFQDGTQDGGQNKIYNQISKIAITSLVKPDGFLCFITPTSVLKDSKRFSLIGQKGLRIVDFTADAHFDVGVKICWWMINPSYSDDVIVKHSYGEEQQSPDDQIFDFSSFEDKDFLKLYSTLKKATNKPEKRMFRQNNFGPAFSKIQDEKHKYELYKINGSGRKITFYSSRVPYFISALKFTISMTKGFSEDAIVVDTYDYDVAHMTTEISSMEEVENIKSFIFSDYFKQHSEKWKQVDGYGYNYSLKYLPPFDKTKRWTSEEVKIFLESFVK